MLRRWRGGLGASSFRSKKKAALEKRRERACGAVSYRYPKGRGDGSVALGPPKKENGGVFKGQIGGEQRSQTISNHFSFRSTVGVNGNRHLERLKNNSCLKETSDGVFCSEDAGEKTTISVGGNGKQIERSDIYSALEGTKKQSRCTLTKGGNFVSRVRK